MSQYLVKVHEEALPIGSCKMYDKTMAMKSSNTSSSWLGAFATEAPNPWIDCQLYLRKNLLFYKQQPAISKTADRKAKLEEKPFYVDLRKCYLHIIPINKPNPAQSVTTTKGNKEMYLFEILSVDGTSRWLFDAETERNQNHFVNILREYVIGSKTRHHHVQHSHHHTNTRQTTTIESEHDEIKFLFKSISHSHADSRSQTQVRVIMHKAMEILPYR
jgi:hypothetical protein